MPDNYANKLDMHPMIEEIADALHAGQTPREVAAWCEPPVSHQTVWKFKKLSCRAAAKRDHGGD